MRRGLIDEGQQGSWLQGSGKQFVDVDVKRGMEEKEERTMKGVE